MKLMRFTIVGLSPGLLLNPATPELLDALRTKKQTQKRTDWTVEDEAGTKLYRSEVTVEEKAAGKNGKMGIPTQNLMSSIVNAGQHVKQGRKGISTAKSTTVFDFLEFMDDFCEFVGVDEKGNIPWGPFLVKGTMHAAGKETAVCINRPRIPHWRITFTVKFDDKRQVDESTLKALVETAGRKIGLCDWRPQKKGRFGRFVIERIETLALKEEKAVITEVEYTEANAPEDLKELAAA